MTLENYLLMHLLEERGIIEELLHIDNTIQKTDYTFSTLIGKIKNKKLTFQSEECCSWITDGDPDTIYQVLLTSPFLKIHINHSFIGINKWLIERAKNYYDENNMENSICLNIEKEYNNYVEENNDIIIYGFDEFVDGMSEVFADKNIMAIKKEGILC